MASPVTTSGKLTCCHSGSPTLSSSTKLNAGGSPVIPFSSLSTFTPYTGCTYVNPSGTNQPCTTATVASGGQASKLTVGGQPALLDDLVAQTENPPTTPYTVTAGQSKVTAS